jgi:hypothetical protein
MPYTAAGRCAQAVALNGGSVLPHADGANLDQKTRGDPVNARAYPPSFCMPSILTVRVFLRPSIMVDLRDLAELRVWRWGTVGAPR